MKFVENVKENRGNIFGKCRKNVQGTSGKMSGKNWEMSGNRFKHSVGKPVKHSVRKPVLQARLASNGLADLATQVITRQAKPIPPPNY